jgi:microsomal epoxide hydrolase
MSSDYAKLPSKATASPKPFTVNVPEEDIANFKTLLKLSPLAQDTYENAQDDRRFGVPMSWMKMAKAEWEKFDWYDHCPLHITLS